MKRLSTILLTAYATFYMVASLPDIHKMHSIAATLDRECHAGNKDVAMRPRCIQLLLEASEIRIKYDLDLNK